MKSAWKALESVVNLAVLLARMASNPSFRDLLDSTNRQAGLVSIGSEARRITDRAANSEAPPRQTLSWEQYTKIRRARDRCEHTNSKGTRVLRKYHAGKNGHFMECPECQRRWKWSAVTEKWEVYDKDAVEAGFICKKTMRLLSPARTTQSAERRSTEQTARPRNVTSTRPASRGPARATAFSTPTPTRGPPSPMNMSVSGTPQTVQNMPAADELQIIQQQLMQQSQRQFQEMLAMQQQLRLQQQAEQEAMVMELARRESEMRMELQEQALSWRASEERQMLALVAHQENEAAIAQTVPDAAGWELTPDRRGSFQRRPSRSSDGSQASQ